MMPTSPLAVQVQMALGGPLGQLQRGVSDVVSEVEVIAEEDPIRQRWTATSAELWPVREMLLHLPLGTILIPGSSWHLAPSNAVIDAFPA